MAFECQRWKKDEVVAQQWGICYVVQFNVRLPLDRTKRYGKVNAACDRLLFSVPKTYGSTTLLKVGKIVGVWRHVSCCRAISDILNDLIA